MILSALTAISPVDGRYRGKTEALASYFSEFALIRYRVRVEAEYFCALTEVLPQLEAANRPEIHEALRRVYLDFSMADAERIKEIERTRRWSISSKSAWMRRALERTASLCTSG